MVENSSMFECHFASLSNLMYLLTLTRNVIYAVSLVTVLNSCNERSNTPKQEITLKQKNISL